MSDQQDNDKQSAPKRRAEDHVRLESWKAIANHLNRSVRTARRWESGEGLPVRRHKHSKGASVYAYRAELDAWQARRLKGDIDDDWRIDSLAGTDENGRRGSSWPRFAAVAVSAFLAGLLVGNLNFSSRNEHGMHQAVAEQGGSFEADADVAKETARIIMAPVFELWAAGKIQASISTSHLIADRAAGLPQPVREALAALRVRHAISLGQTRDAIVIAESIGDDVQRRELRALAFLTAGDAPAAQAELRKNGNSSSDLGEILAVIGGLAEQRTDDAHYTSETDRNRGMVIDGLTALQEGDLDAAAKYLGRASLVLDAGDRAYFFVTLDSLASVYQQQGNPMRAVEMLEMTSTAHVESAMRGDGIFWLMCQWQLARLYHDSDRPDDARKIRERLQRYLAMADEGFPLRRQASRPFA